MADSEEQLIVVCPCEQQQKMRVPASGMGKTYKCVKCGRPVHVNERNSQRPSTSSDASRPEPEPSSPIGQLLLDEGAVNEAQIEEALRVQRQEGGKTFETLIRLGYLDKDQLHAILSKQPGVATIDLSRFDIGDELVQLIPKEVATENLVLPIDRLGKLLTVAMACPLDAATVSRIEEETGLRVKAMLCKYDDIRAAVEKHYGKGAKGSGEMAVFELPPGSPAEEAQRRIEKLERLVVPAETLERFVQAGRKPGVTPKELVQAAGSNPALAAVLLGTANSSAYGLPGEVDTVALAVALLGPEGAAAAAEKGLEAAGEGAVDLQPLGDRATRCAFAAALLAQTSGRLERGVAHTAALVSQAGRYTLAALDPAKYSRIDPAAWGKEAASAERNVFALTHAEAGAALYRHWGLPESLVKTSAQYLAPQRGGAYEELVAVTHLAAGLVGLGGDAEEAQLEPYGPSLQCLGLSAKDALAAVHDVVGA